MKELQADKTILWVGPDLSKASPTCLPDGKEQFEYMSEVLFGASALQKINHKIDAYNNFIHEIDCNIGRVLYSDVMISHWNKIKAVDVNAGLHNFVNAPFNQYHCYLAMFLAEGAHIITTNIDLCIEKAYEALMDGKVKMNLKEHDNSVYIYESADKKAGKIFHIHGTAENSRDVGGNLRIGEEYFSKAFRESIYCFMNEGYEVYYLGYDCRDIYDVNIYINYQSKQVNKLRWKGNVVSTKFRKDQPQNMKKMLKTFVENAVIRQETVDFLKESYAKIKPCLPQEAEGIINELLCKQSAKDFEWKPQIKLELNKVKPYKDIILLYINQILGVRVDEIDLGIYERLEEMSVDTKNMYASLLFRFQYNLIADYGYCTQTVNMEKEEGNFYRELIILSENPYNRRNKDIIDLKEQIEEMQEGYISALRRKTETTRWENEAEEMLEDIEVLLLLEQPDKVEVIPVNNYIDYAQLYRLRAAVRTMYCNDKDAVQHIQEDLCKVYIYNSQSADIHGILETLRYASFCYSSFYYKFGKKSYYDKAQKFKTLRKNYEKNNGYKQTDFSIT